MPYSTNPRILLIDNYSDSSQLIDMLLYIKKCNYIFSTADTLRKALELIGAGAFDLYILEHKLPEMNGIELCRQIRCTDKKTPILFFNKRERDFDREISIAAGASEFLIKPSNLDQIADTIKRLLGGKIQDFVPQTPSTANYSNKTLSRRC